LVDFLAFANREPSFVRSFVAEFEVPAPAFIRPALSGRRTWVRKVEILSQRAVPRAASRQEFEHILLGRGAVGAEAATLVRRWFTLRRRLDRAGDVLFGTLNHGGQWLENRLLNLTSFSEAYHERFHDEPRFDAALNSRVMKELVSLVPEEVRPAYREKLGYAWKQTQRTRIRELVERAVDPVPALEPWEKSLTGQLVDTRNHLTHWGKAKPTVLEGADLFWAVERLAIVLQANLLLDLRLDPNAIEYASPALDPTEELP
jgi:hypothetical protein